MIRADLAPLLFLIFLSSTSTTLNQIFLKSAINSMNMPVEKNLLNVLVFMGRLLLRPKVWISGIFSLISLCIWLFVLSKAELNFAFSIDSMHYIFIAFFSGSILKERVDIRRWLGTLCIVVGIAIVSLS